MNTGAVCSDAVKGSDRAVSVFFLPAPADCGPGPQRLSLARERQGGFHSMKIIAGLGNPGREYVKTRHNTGFEVIDILSEEYHFPAQTRDGKSLVAKGYIEGEKVLLMKPQTYMNLSGEAIREQVDFYKADPETDVIVICDDIDQPLGQIRVRPKGSAGGHNGLKNIILNLGTDGFTRIRVGVGAKPSPDYDLADYVLGHPTGEDRELLDSSEKRAAEAVPVILTEGVEEAMNRFNTKCGRRKSGQ